MVTAHSGAPSVAGSVFPSAATRGHSPQCSTRVIIIIIVVIVIIMIFIMMTGADSAVRVKHGPSRLQRQLRQHCHRPRQGSSFVIIFVLIVIYVIYVIYVIVVIIFFIYIIIVIIICRTQLSSSSSKQFKFLRENLKGQYHKILLKIPKTTR